MRERGRLKIVRLLPESSLSDAVLIPARGLVEKSATVVVQGLALTIKSVEGEDITKNSKRETPGE